MAKSLFAVVLCVALLTSTVNSQTTSTQSFILNYTLNAVPKDVIHISLAEIIKAFPTLTKASCATVKILGDSSTATIEVRDSEPTVSGPSQAVPLHLLVKLKDKVGPIQYQLDCISGQVAIIATGTIITEAGNSIKDNGTSAIVFKVRSDFVSNSEYLMKDMGYWPIRLFEGNNLKLTQEPGAPTLLNEFIPAVRPIVLMEKSGDKYVPTTLTKLKKISFSCPSVPSSFMFNCLIGLKEDGKTAVMFNSGAGYSNDFRWTKNAEKVLNNDAAFEFEDCFMHIGTQSSENVCYFWNSVTKKTKFVPVHSDTAAVEIAARVTGVRSLSQITCFIVDENNIKKLACINTENTIMTELSGMLASAVTSIKIANEGGCSLKVDDLVVRTFDTNLMFDCPANLKVVVKLDLEKAGKTGLNGKYIAFGTDLPIVTGSARKVDAGVGTVSAFLCGNEHHIAFLVDNFKQIAFQGVKYPGQILFSNLDVAGVTAINQIVCTGLATDFVATAGSDKYFVSLSSLNRDPIEYQRVNLIYKMGDKDALDVSNDGNMAIIFKKAQSTYELKDILELNRVLGNLKTYDPTVTQVGDYVTKIKAASTGDAKIIVRDYKFSYFSTTPSISQKANSKAPLSSKVNVYDYFDVTGIFGTVTVDPPNANIIFNSSTQIDNQTLTLNTAGSRFVLGKWHIDTDVKKYYNTAGTSIDLPNVANILTPSKLLAVVDNEIAVTVGGAERTIIQIYSLNKAGDIAVSNQFTLPSAVLDYYSFGKVTGSNGLTYLAIAITWSEGFNNAVYNLINYAVDGATGAFTFTKTTDINSTSLFTPDQVSSPFGIDKFYLAAWNDPTHSRCLNLILSEGGLTMPWVYKVCNLDTQTYSAYTLKNVKKLDADKVEIEFWAGSLAKEFGNSVTLYTIEGKMFDAGKPVIPTTVSWTQKSALVFNNGVGGMVKQYVTLNDEAILITKEVAASKGMFISARSLKTYVSYFKQNKLVSQVFENLPVSEVRYWAYVFNNNFRLITQTDNASGKKTVIKDFRITNPTIEFSNSATSQNVGTSSFVFNKGQPNEVKVPITAALNPPTTPPAAPSSGGSIWIWIIVIIILLVVAVGAYFLFFRREKIRRDSQAGKTGNDSHIEEHL
jgi:hypothetical protein